MLTLDSHPARVGDRAADRPASPATRRRRARAVVIGSGFGGLASAVRFAARGYAVTLIERCDQLGGRARVFRQDGFTFDAGPTIITAPELLDELWAVCGRNRADDVELRSLDPFYRLRFDDGDVFECGPDPEKMRAEVGRISPDDVAGYERFMAVSRQMYERGYENLAHRPFPTVWSMAQILPDLARLRADRSVYGLASRMMRHPKLRLAYSFHPLFVGGNPMTATAFYSMISHLERGWGVHFAMGGTGALIAGMAKLLQDQGGEIRLQTEAEAILSRDGAVSGVRLSCGETLPADVVVSNADAAWTYSKLLKETRRRRWTDRKVARARQSMGIFLWYFGTRRRYEDVAHHTIVLGPRYRELLRDIFRRKRLADDFSLYLHRPTATDPSLAPPGCDAFYALSPVPNLESGVDWRAQGEKYRQAVQRRLSETVLPGLEAEVVSSRIMTPQDFRDELLAVQGAAFGLEPVLTQMAWFRPHNQSEELRNLFLVGAGTHPGAGVPGVLNSAKVVDRVAPDVSAFV